MLQTGCGNHLKWCAISWATDKDMHFSHTGLFLRPRNFKSKKNLFPGLHSHLLRHLKFQPVIKVLQLKKFPLITRGYSHFCLFAKFSKTWRTEELSKAIRWSGLSATDTWTLWSTQKDLWKSLWKMRFWKSLWKIQFWKSPQKMQFCTGWQVLLLRATRPLSDAQDPVCFQPTALACKSESCS